MSKNLPFERKLGLARRVEELRIVGVDLPFERQVVERVHELSIASHHGSRRILAEQTTRLGEVAGQTVHADGVELSGALDLQHEASSVFLEEVEVFHLGDRTGTIHVVRLVQGQRGFFAVNEQLVILGELENVLVDTDRGRLNVRPGIFDGRTDVHVEILVLNQDQVAFSVERITRGHAPTLKVRV